MRSFRTFEALSLPLSRTVQRSTIAENALERSIIRAVELEFEKSKIEQLFSDGKVADDAIERKANELQAIIKKMEAKEERWFELSAKME